MSTLPDILDDFTSLTDWLNPVTLTLRGSGTSYAIAHAHRNQVDTTEHTPSAGDVKQGDTIWQFPVAESVSVSTNLLGSTITDTEGVTHTILSAALQVWNSKWEVRTRDLIVENGLDTLVTLAACEYYKHSSSGEAIETWATLYADLRAKIQLETIEAVIGHHADESKRSYRITLAQELDLVVGANYRVVAADGSMYRTLSYHNSTRIDALPYLIARRVER